MGKESNAIASVEHAAIKKKNQRYPPLFRASQSMHPASNSASVILCVRCIISFKKKKRSPSRGYHQQQNK
jgi:hypothetical protein